MTHPQVFILGILVINSVSGTVVTPQQNDTTVETTDNPIKEPVLERRQDVNVQDNVAQSSGAVTSFSSVVIHHPSAGNGPPAKSQWTIENHKSNTDHVLSSRGPGRQAHKQSHHHSQHEEYQEDQPQTQTPRPRQRHQTRANSHESTRTTSSERGLLKTGKNYYRLNNPSETGEGYFVSSEAKNPREYPVLATPTPQYFTPSPQVFQSPQPPAGMTNELMKSLLNQQPQTFDYGYRTSTQIEHNQRSITPAPEALAKSDQTVRPSRKPQKKYKSHSQSESSEKSKKRLNNQKRPDSFNVGYSIGFGNPGPTQETVLQPAAFNQQIPQDVVLGLPKNNGKPNFRVQMQGENSVWKEIQPGVEISQENLHNNAIPINTQVVNAVVGNGVFDPQTQIGLFSGYPGTPVYLVNGLAQPDVYNVPTTGQSSFDHEYAIGNSNTFDFSNARSQPYPNSQIASPQNKQDSPNVPTKRLKGHHSGKKGKNANLESQPTLATPQAQLIPALIQQPTVGMFPYSLDYQKQAFALNQPRPIGGNYQTSSASNKVVLQAGSRQQDYPMTTGTGGFDLSHYMGIGTPVPVQNVFIPGVKQGEGQMVPAIVIPISQLNGFENFGGSPLQFGGDSKDGLTDVFNVVPSNTKGAYNSGRPHAARHNIKGGSSKGKGQEKYKSQYDTAKQASFLAPSFGDPNGRLNPPVPQRNARLAKLQKELNTILAEEMYWKNHPSRSGRPALG